MTGDSRSSPHLVGNHRFCGVAFQHRKPTWHAHAARPKDPSDWHGWPQKHRVEILLLCKDEKACHHPQVPPWHPRCIVVLHPVEAVDKQTSVSKRTVSFPGNVWVAKESGVDGVDHGWQSGRSIGRMEFIQDIFPQSVFSPKSHVYNECDCD